MNKYQVQLQHNSGSGTQVYYQNVEADNIEGAIERGIEIIMIDHGLSRHHIITVNATKLENESD